MRYFVHVLVIVALFAATAAISASSGTNRKDTCHRLLPKGGGTVVNSVFVPLNPGQYLKLCTTGG